MGNDFIKNFTATEKLKATFSRFGKAAVYMDFITVEQLKDALAKQVDEDLTDKPHRLIGRILFEHGWITSDQINFVVLLLSSKQKNLA
jgi:hypothetical protein